MIINVTFTLEEKSQILQALNFRIQQLEHKISLVDDERLLEFLHNELDVANSSYNKMEKSMLTHK